MSFIDSLHWGWVCYPLFPKLLLLALFVIGVAFISLFFFRREIASFFMGIGVIALVLWVFYSVSSPTTKGLVSMYESGDINKSELSKFLPYAIMQDKAREDTLRLQKEKNTIEEEEARKKKEQREYRRKEAEELVKKNSK